MPKNPNLLDVDDICHGITYETSRAFDAELLITFGYAHRMVIRYFTRGEQRAADKFYLAMLGSKQPWDNMTRLYYAADDEIVWFFIDETDLVKAKFIYDDIAAICMAEDE